MAKITYYFGTYSPWAYLGGNRLEEVATRHGAEITYRPLDQPALITRTGGTLGPNRPEARRSYQRQELIRWAARLGMALNPSPAHFPVNGAPAAYVIIAAQAKGAAVGPLVQAILRAVWAEDRDIADDATLRTILEAEGHDPDLVNSGLLTGAETYARNLDAALAAGVFGAPTYVIEETGARFWGQDRLDFLDEALAAL